MELLELFYVALGTIGVLVFLHLGTFWVARMLQPPKPKIVYLREPAAAAPPPPPPPPVLSEAATKIQLPTYDTAPQPAAPAVASLPPPVETRSTTKQSGGDIGPPR
jgi:hypothetical protein